MQTAKSPPALLIRSEAVRRDVALALGARGARKLLVTELYERLERLSDAVAWEPPQGSEPCPVALTKNLELAVFNAEAVQDRHRHALGTEIYSVLSGEMEIEVEGERHLLVAGDVIVVKPGSAHEVHPDGRSFLCLVVTANCTGAADKEIVPPADSGADGARA